jgi:hypothetical protein
MSLYWVLYKDGDTTSVFVSEASSLVHASMKAGIAGTPGKFTEGHVLDPRTANKVPKGMTGRPLSLKEAQELVEMLG